MLSSIMKQEKKFIPVKLLIEFESEYEVMEFYSLLNSIPVTSSLEHVDHRSIRSALTEYRPITGRNDMFKRFSHKLREYFSEGSA